MITAESRELAGVPTLLMCRDDEGRIGGRGTILFFHGLHASKEVQHKELYSLAEHGFLVVGVDVIGHGERRYPDAARRFSAANPDIESDIDEVVIQTVAEIPAIIDALCLLKLSHESRFGIGGISLGAYIAYQAIIAEPRLSVATPILGSPIAHCDRPDSPHRHPEKFFPVAILSQNAGQDANVPPAPARQFHQALRPFYELAPERLRHEEYKGVGHFMPENVWLKLWSEVLRWFDTFL
ncbi:alpha/beta hydrolase family protein [candidate division CSSED10-310 bacterium]|uniref:Alpha/beta hydrolase family protein n=1 Tax=candidate division CSSED10-310 bacterium TaxID=2855610 RepID=A0ABV6YX52_UNCC1